MTDKWSRRRMMQTAGAAALLPVPSLAAVKVAWPPAEGPNTPKIWSGPRP